MRFRCYFCEDKLVRDLLDEFQLSQGPLYHFTNRNASEGICSGEIWITRADCFLDSTEIETGLQTLSSVPNHTNDEQEAESFKKIVGALRGRLETCFVLSLTQNSSNQLLHRNYAGDDGAVIEFWENFPAELYQGWHCQEIGNEAYRSHYLVDNYDLVEGFVVYDLETQNRIALRAFQAYRQILANGAQRVDVFHLCNVLVKCLVLFKSSSYEDESEYRVALIRKPGVTGSFVEKRCIRGRSVVFAKVRISARCASLIHVKDA